MTDEEPKRRRGGTPNRKCIRWTPEEDRIIRVSPPWMTAKQLQKTLYKATGIHRNEISVSDRRRVLNPDYDLEPAGWIRLSNIAGQGARGNVTSQVAIRAAKEDGALRIITIRGVKRRIVPMKWADEWLAKKQRESDEYQHALDHGWLLTKDIADALGKPWPAFHGWLRRAFTEGNSIYKVFNGIKRVKGFRRELYWEPVATRAAIQTIKEHERRNRMLKRQLWSAKKVAAFLGVHIQTVHDRCGRLKALDALPHERNSKGWYYWNPAAIIALAETLKEEDREAA